MCMKELSIWKYIIDDIYGTPETKKHLWKMGVHQWVNKKADQKSISTEIAAECQAEYNLYQNQKPENDYKEKWR